MGAWISRCQESSGCIHVSYFQPTLFMIKMHDDDRTYIYIPLHIYEFTIGELKKKKEFEVTLNSL